MRKTHPNGDPEDAPMTERDIYNVVTDTIVGPNVRPKDNLYQGLAILAGLFLGAGIGAISTRDLAFGAMVGGFVGTAAGLFGSGIFLMIYRAVRHSRGKHD